MEASKAKIGHLAQRLAEDAVRSALRELCDLQHDIGIQSEAQESRPVNDIHSVAQSEREQQQQLRVSLRTRIRSRINGLRSRSRSKSRGQSSSPNSRRLKKSIGSWLRDRSKYLSNQSVSSDEQTRPSRSILKPWKKWTRPRQNNQNVQRELPPVPNNEISNQINDIDVAQHSPDDDEELANLSIQMANLPPGTAFFPDDDDEDGLHVNDEGGLIDFAKSLEIVKDCGWYWGPISGEAAEKLLCNEPDGSFVVRDSSADHYIFSLSFKLDGSVRHVRIDHNQGSFSFGSFAKFKSKTIVDFIENAVEHSRSGSLLFFLHRRPVLGPTRVQLLYPVSRFKQVQSLQHQCRFVILRLVPRDLLHELPVPPKIQEYLNTPFYYSETMADLDKNTGDTDTTVTATTPSNPAL